jgi:hypothetical protein
MLSACVMLSPVGPQDLRLVSVKAVDYRDASEILSIGKGPRPALLLLKIEFSSKRDLMKLSQEREFSIYNNPAICPNSDQPIKVKTFPSVYWSNMEVKQTSLPPLPCAGGSDEVPKVYHIYVVVSQFERDSYYDLKQHPESICFYVAGGDMLGRTLSSNIVRIPREIIAESLARVRLQTAPD